MDELFLYTLVRSRRRTLSVEIKNKKVIVRAPLFLGQSYIEHFLKNKRSWIESRLKLLPPKEKVKRFADGEEFAVLGRNYRLRLIFSNHKEIELVKDNLVVSAADLNPKYIRKLIENYYIDLLRSETEAICAKYKDKFDLSGRKLLFKFYRSKWGSCSAKNCLSFNAKLAQAPQDVIEYVVVHELVHLEIKNHSRNFWLTVSRFCPNYKSSRDYLNKKLHLHEI